MLFLHAFFFFSLEFDKVEIISAIIDRRGLGQRRRGTGEKRAVPGGQGQRLWRAASITSMPIAVKLQFETADSELTVSR